LNLEQIMNIVHDVGLRNCIWRHDNAALYFFRFDYNIWENINRQMAKTESGNYIPYECKSYYVEILQLLSA
jgi:hypothetical protein